LSSEVSERYQTTNQVAADRRYWVLATVMIVQFVSVLSSTIVSTAAPTIVDELHAARGSYEYVILNPGAFTHYAYAIADAVSSIGIPVIEVHMSNIFAREEFRRKSVVAPVCAGTIGGFGADSYLLALRAAAHKI